jgi:hypothetical protein
VCIVRLAVGDVAVAEDVALGIEDTDLDGVLGVVQADEEWYDRRLPPGPWPSWRRWRVALHRGGDGRIDRAEGVSAGNRSRVEGDKSIAVLKPGLRFASLQVP